MSKLCCARILGLFPLLDKKAFDHAGSGATIPY